MRVLIIDDETLSRSVLKKYLELVPGAELAGECSNGFEGVKAINELKPDLVLLDIQMPKLTGFEMLELIDSPPPVIFITAYDEYALKAFEVNAVDYLLKPVSEERFKQAVLKVKSETAPADSDVYRSVIEKSTQKLERIVIKNGNSIIVIAPEDIKYAEAQDDYVCFVMMNGTKHLKKQTLRFYEEKLPEGNFVRIHRGYLLNITMLKEIQPLEKDTYTVVLTDGTKLPASKSGWQKLKEIWNG